MQRAKKFLQLATAILALPFVLLSLVLTGAYYVVAGPRQRRKQFRQRWELARRLGLDRGEVHVRDLISGGPMNTSIFSLVTVRPGPPDIVEAEIADGVAAEGYRRHMPPQTIPAPPGIAFVPPSGAGLPRIHVAITGPGTRIARTDVDVPDGHCGVRFTI